MMHGPQLMVASSLRTRRLVPQPGSRFSNVRRWAIRRIFAAWRFDPRLEKLRAEFGSRAELTRLVGRFSQWVLSGAAAEYRRGNQSTFRQSVWSRVRAKSRAEFGKAWVENEFVDAFLKGLLVWLFDLLIVWLQAQFPVAGTLASATASAVLMAVLEGART